MKLEKYELIFNKLKEEVSIASALGEIPVGAVIFDSEGNIIGSGHNTRQFSYNVLGHAEINAILDAENKIKDWRLNGYSMVVSLEPCEMCSSVIKACRLNNIYYLVKSKNEHTNSLNNICYLNSKEFDEYRCFFSKLIMDFFDNKR